MSSQIFVVFDGSVPISISESNIEDAMEKAIQSKVVIGDDINFGQAKFELFEPTEEQIKKLQG